MLTAGDEDRRECRRLRITYLQRAAPMPVGGDQRKNQVDEVKDKLTDRLSFPSNNVSRPQGIADWPLVTVNCKPKATSLEFSRGREATGEYLRSTI